MMFWPLIVVGVLIGVHIAVALLLWLDAYLQKD